MSAFPAAGYMTNASRDEGEFKTALDSFLAATKLLHGASAQAAYTVASGSITPTVATMTVDSESAAASDDLETVQTTNFNDGNIIIIRNFADARNIVVKNGTGNITTLSGSDVTLDTTKQYMMLMLVSSTWYEILPSFAVSAGCGILLNTYLSNPAIPSGVDGSRLIKKNYVQLEYQQAAGTDGGEGTQDAWTAYPINTEVSDLGSHSTAPASNKWTLGQGDYEVEFYAIFMKCDYARMRLRNLTTTTTIARSSSGYAANGGKYAGGIVSGRGRITMNGTDEIGLEYYLESLGSEPELGIGLTAQAETEVYGQFIARKVG